MEFSVILTAARESGTIEKALQCIADPVYSGANWSNGEILLVAPDQETLNTGRNFLVRKHPHIQAIYIKDAYTGKPTALNLAFSKARGKVLILTDGDVFLGEKSISRLLLPFKELKTGGVTGRPIARNGKRSYWGYIGNLLADAAHHKRVASMRRDIGGKSLKLIEGSPGFFVMSGYVSAIRNLKLRLPKDTLVDDAYLSYQIINSGLNITYVPEATAYVKYPTNLSDWYRQKIRSVGGYMQLYKYDVVPPGKKVRNFWKELEYIWFPVSYSRNLKEFIWSVTLYPLRLWMWIRIFWDQKIRKREFYQVWERIESTK